MQHGAVGRQQPTADLQFSLRACAATQVLGRWLHAKQVLPVFQCLDGQAPVDFERGTTRVVLSLSIACMVATYTHMTLLQLLTFSVLA